MIPHKNFVGWRISYDVAIQDLGGSVGTAIPRIQLRPWLSLIAALVVFGTNNLKAEPVEWHSDLAVATELARTQNKLLLVEFTSSGCGWCRRMEQKTHTDPRVIAAQNSDYVCVRIVGGDADFRTQHLVRGTPHTLILAPTPTGVQRLTGRAGYQPASDYLAMLASGLRRRTQLALSVQALAALVESEDRLQVRTFDLDAALQAADRSIGIDARLADAYALRGQALYLKHEPAQAQAALLRAIEVDDQDPMPHDNLGCALYDQGDFDGAARHFKIAWTRWGNDAGDTILRWWLAEARAGRLDDATQALRDALANGYAPGDWFTRYLMRHVLGDLSEEQLLQAIEKRGPGYACSTRFYLGSVALVRGDRAAAEQHLELCVRTQQVRQYEHVLALFELRRLQASPATGGS